VGFAIAGAAIVAAGCGNDPKPRTPTPAERLTVQQLLGQRVIAGFTGPKPPQRLLIAIRQGAVGGVILFGDNVSSKRKTQRLTQRLQREAALAKQPYLFVMTDQEGGDVKRLSWAPPKHSPMAIGRKSDVAGAAHSEGTLTGAALRAAGVNVDLAPVADVLGAPPGVSSATAAVTGATGGSTTTTAATGATGVTGPVESPGAFLGTRSFGESAKTVASAACEFSAGMQNAAVAATMKHFPGLGLAQSNTDFATTEITASAKQLRAAMLPYERCPKTPKLVMVSSAKYPALGISKPASLTPEAYALLGKTGFRGLTITDAYDTVAIKGYKNAPMRAMEAGADLILFGQKTTGATRSYDKLLAAAQAGEIKKSELIAAADRILALKRQLKSGSWTE
jgi:beta-N-acetylhexosaminidase